MEENLVLANQMQEMHQMVITMGNLMVNPKEDLKNKNILLLFQKDN
jgi:hypothetical protein